MWLVSVLVMLNNEMHVKKCDDTAMCNGRDNCVPVAVMSTLAVSVF